EVDHAVVALVTAPAPPGRDLARVVAAPGTAERLDERLVRRRRRDLVERLHALEPAARRRGSIVSDRHDGDPLCPFHKLRHLLAGLEADPCFLPVRTLTLETALALELAVA